MTRPTLRRGAAFTAAAALLAGVAVAAPMVASAVPDPAAVPASDIAYIDTATSTLTSSLPTGSGAAAIAPTGVGAAFFAASTDTTTANSTVVTGYRTTASTSPRDTTAGLVVTHGGVSKVLSTYTDVNPVVSADGATVWFLVRGNLYSYDVVGGTTTQINGAAEFNPWAATAGNHTYIYRLAVSTDGSKAAELIQSYPDAGATGVNRSQIRVFDISTPTPTVKKNPIWTSFNYTGAANKQPLPYNLVFTDPSTLVIGECVDYLCETWTSWGIDTTTAADGAAALAPASGVTALPNLDNLLGLKGSQGTWYAWKLDLVAHILTPYTTTDAAFASPLTAGADWAAGSDKFLHYITPLADTPAVFSSLATKMGVAPTLTLSAKVVPTGSRVRFNAFGTYPAPASGQVLQKETATVGRGTLQYSINNGVTWARVGTTTAGGGGTQMLTRNTRFRWVYPGDVLTSPATSGAPLVYVIPSLSVKVTKSGTSRIVSGVTSRIGGSVTLYKLSGKTWKKVLTTPVKTKGAYSFGKRALAKGTYRVVTSADASWPATGKAFKIV